MNPSQILTRIQINIIETISSYRENRNLKKAKKNLWLARLKVIETDLSISKEKFEEFFEWVDVKLHGYKVVDKRVGEKQ
jgi:hypothetical protein